MQTPESTTKTRGLFARLFGSEDAQPTPHDVDTQIMKVEQERADLAAELAIVQGEIAENWGEDTTSLEQQVITLNSKIAAAGQVLQRLQAERVEALARQVLDTYRHKVE